MKRIYPTSVIEEVSDDVSTFRNVMKEKTTGKKGPTQKGLLKKIRDAKKQGKDATKLEKMALAVEVNKCGVCRACFRYESQLSHHREREHKDDKCYARLITPGVGYVCKVCGIGAATFADGRALKRHYRDRTLHGAKELVHAGVKLWALISRSKEDMAVVRDVYVEQGIIEPAESSDSGGSSNESEGSRPV